MTERYGLGAFRSRQQVLRFEAALKKSGIDATIISTPREVAIGCGLSVKFKAEDMDRVVQEYKRTAPTALVGFYYVERENGIVYLKGVKVFSLGVDDLTVF